MKDEGKMGGDEEDGIALSTLRTAGVVVDVQSTTSGMECTAGVDACVPVTITTTQWHN